MRRGRTTPGSTSRSLATTKTAASTPGFGERRQGADELVAVLGAATASTRWRCRRSTARLVSWPWAVKATSRSRATASDGDARRRSSAEGGKVVGHLRLDHRCRAGRRGRRRGAILVVAGTRSQRLRGRATRRGRHSRCYLRRGGQGPDARSAPTNWDERQGSRLEADGKIVVGGWVYEGSQLRGQLRARALRPRRRLDPALRHKRASSSPRSSASDATRRGLGRAAPERRARAHRARAARRLLRASTNSDFAVTRFWR